MNVLKMNRIFFWSQINIFYIAIKEINENKKIKIKKKKFKCFSLLTNKREIIEKDGLIFDLSRLL